MYTKPEALRTSAEQKRCPFGFCWQLGKRIACKMPTLTFYQWLKAALPHSQYGAPTASPRPGPRGWLLILETGISRSKLLGPRWADIGREQPCIHIRQQLASYRSPGQEKLAIASNGSKNKFRRPTIPIIE